IHCLLNISLKFKHTCRVCLCIWYFLPGVYPSRKNVHTDRMIAYRSSPTVYINRQDGCNGCIAICIGSLTLRKIRFMAYSSLQSVQPMYAHVYPVFQKACTFLPMV